MSRGPGLSGVRCPEPLQPACAPQTPERQRVGEVPVGRVEQLAVRVEVECPATATAPGRDTCTRWGCHMHITRGQARAASAVGLTACAAARARTQMTTATSIQYATYNVTTGPRARCGRAPLVSGEWGVHRGKHWWARAVRVRHPIHTNYDDGPRVEYNIVVLSLTSRGAGALSSASGAELPAYDAILSHTRI
jgi:hypothetical protein